MQNEMCPETYGEKWFILIVFSEDFSFLGHSGQTKILRKTMLQPGVYYCFVYRKFH